MNNLLQIRLLWQKWPAFRIYILLLFLAFLKQLIFETGIVDVLEYTQAFHNFSFSGFSDSSGNLNQNFHWLPETRRSVGYVLLLFLIQNSHLLLFIIQFLLALSVPVIAYRYMELKKIPAQKQPFFMWFFLLFPLQYFYTCMAVPEIICQWLLLLSLFQFLGKNWWLTAVYASFLVLLKPVFLVLMPLLFIYFILSPKKRYPLLAPLVFLCLTGLYNKKNTGLFHFSSMGVENAWEYNARAVLNVVMTDAEREIFYQKRDAQLAGKNFIQRYQFLQSETKIIITGHWKLYLWLHAKGTLLALVDPGRYDLVAFAGLPSGTGFMGVKEKGGLSGWLSQPWYILVYIFVFIFINISRLYFVSRALIYDYKNWIPEIVVLILLIGVIGPVGSARYLLPVIPLLCILAAHGIKLSSIHAKNSADQ